MAENKPSYLNPLNPNEFPKKSAMTPIGAYSFGVLSVSVAGAVVTFPSLLSWGLLALSFLTVLSTIWVIQHFVRFDADRLQTEDYRIRKEVVARITNHSDYSDLNLPPSDAPNVIDLGNTSDE